MQRSSKPSPRHDWVLCIIQVILHHPLAFCPAVHWGSAAETPPVLFMRRLLTIEKL
jgi:hypothetical protein